MVILKTASWQFFCLQLKYVIKKFKFNIKNIKIYIYKLNTL